MKLPRSLRSGERNGKERSSGLESGSITWGQDVVLLCQRIPKQDASLSGCREGVAGHFPLEWVKAMIRTG